jgi:hypothetical protein
MHVPVELPTPLKGWQASVASSPSKRIPAMLAGDQVKAEDRPIAPNLVLQNSISLAKGHKKYFPQ